MCQNRAWASYQIRKIACFAYAGNAGNVFPATEGKRSRYASRHVRHARAVIAGIPISVSFEVGVGETFPAFSAHAQGAITRIW